MPKDTVSSESLDQARARALYTEGDGEGAAPERGATAAPAGALTLPQGMDWGVLAVYSCTESCEQSQEEFAVVQVPVE